MSLIDRNGPIAIDPPGCGCTECLTGEYVPLERATRQQILDLFAGHLRDNTGSGVEFTVVVSVNEGDYTWKLSAADLIQAISGGAR